MNRFPLPPDDRLEQLLREAFELMPGPDMRRITQIGSRLARSSNVVRPLHKLNTLPWWIVILMVGSLAAASWWAGETLLDNPTVEDRVSPPAETIPTNPDADSGEPGAGPAGPGQYDQRNPFIYQREAL